MAKAKPLDQIFLIFLSASIKKEDLFTTGRSTTRETANRLGSAAGLALQRPSSGLGTVQVVQVAASFRLTTHARHASI